MGNDNSYIGETENLLYYPKPFTSTLYYWASNQDERLDSPYINLIHEAKNFELWGRESISTSNGCIYFIGGLAFDSKNPAVKHLQSNVAPTDQ
jgi:hypothetical protein